MVRLLTCSYHTQSSFLWAETVQGALLRNILQALSETGADKKLKRVILVNGAKQYGVHLGPSKVPCEESDPRVEGPGRPPNFYYNQQNILAELSKGETWDWVRPLIMHNLSDFMHNNCTSYRS